MATVHLIGLAHHNLPISEEEFDEADFEPGYKYELIDGRVYVSSEPELPEICLEKWLTGKLERYAGRRPHVINFVVNKARVYVPSRPDLTVPEPDVAAYRNFPRPRRFQGLRWRKVSPILVAEVLVASDPFKDLVRNVGLYQQVSSIREYWILDGRKLVDEPVLIVHRRRGKQWLDPQQITYGETYATRLLPGFKLLVDPHR